MKFFYLLQNQVLFMHGVKRSFYLPTPPVLCQNCFALAIFYQEGIILGNFRIQSPAIIFMAYNTCKYYLFSVQREFSELVGTFLLSNVLYATLSSNFKSCYYEVLSCLGLKMYLILHLKKFRILLIIFCLKALICSMGTVLILVKLSN